MLHTTKDQSQAIVGDRVTMGHNVTFHGAICGSNSLIGMGSTVLDNARIGSHVLLGAGSLVPVGREIPDGVMAYGSPVRVVRDLSTEELDWIEFSWRIYVERAARYALRDADGDGDGDAGGEPGNRPPGAN